MHDLAPELFGARKERVHLFPELSSTMDTARRLAVQGCADGTVVIAARQTGGRGRLDRKWISGPGGLYFTLVLRPRIPAEQAWKVLFCAGAGLCEALMEKCGVPARVKWPNDILVSGRKLSGMLTEMTLDGDRVKYLNLGVGVNVANDPGEERAISLLDLTGKVFSRSMILTAFLDDLEPRLAALGDTPVLPRWKALCGTIGQMVSIQTLRGSFEGTAVDVAEDGSLVVQTAGGEVRVSCGDCFHRAAGEGPPEIREER
ncbi:MAG: biotin--[acetyl-CoA-carboxylase] ligase [Thermodesulfobacteriota bacterium]